eukprot:GGOE01010402.1.p1 GENE.GGOE01010402.1~~GGOE01010402.1.p1  ORF type:complete len:1092 (+),score=344.30 GGOE01010402.1:41-3277(+)
MFHALRPLSRLLLLPLLFLLAAFPPGLQGREYRSYDGTGNNVDNPQWGSAGQPFLRYLNHWPRYQNDNSSMVNTTNARTLSNALAALYPKRMNTRFLNDIHTAWGQFIALDLFMPLPNASDPADIAVPACDPWLDRLCNGHASQPFHRSAYTVQGSGRQQLNNVSGFLDGSVVYGTDSVRAAALRTFVGGLMKNNSAGEPPLNTADLHQHNPLCFNATALRMTGDPRGNISPQVLALISLFIREHNRYCQLLAASNPTWDDETLYQEARRRVIAHIQFITFNEYLPILIGGALVLYSGYNASVDPSIENFFATAASQYSIAMINGEVMRLTKDYVASPGGHIPLRQAVYNPAVGLQDGVEPVLRGMLFNLQGKVETNVDDDARNHWLENPGVAPPRDLLALTIQQGRDHGLLTYNEMRQLYGLSNVTWATLTTDTKLSKALQGVYPSINQVDALVGALAEVASRGVVGSLTVASLKEQFLRLRAGDRFWYENDQFDNSELGTIQTTSLTDILNRNTGVDWPYDLIFYRSDAQADGGFFQTPLAVSTDLEAQYNFSLQLSGSFWLYWSVDYTQQIIRFAANIRASGYIGLGFLEQSSDRAPGSYMSHVDNVCGRFVNGTSVVEDYYSYDLGAPSLDTALGCTSDVLDASLEVAGGVRTLRFSRRFVTVDSTAARGRLLDSDDAVKKAQVVYCDVEFTMGQEYSIPWGFHPTSDAWTYHGAYRGVGNAVLVPYTKSSSSGTARSNGLQASSAVIWIAIGIGIGVLILALLITVTFMRHQKQKRLQNAPRSSPFCLMFTDIEQSTLLWSTDPVVMAELIEAHNAIIRRVITQHKAYEVKTIGDSFMIAVQSPTAAVRIATSIQLELYRYDWSPAVLGLLRKVFPTAFDLDAPLDLSHSVCRSLWNGPRVRIGMHYVAPDSRIAVELDRTSGRFDYFGPPVNTTARVESAASGGQILASSELIAACPELHADATVVVQSLGPIVVKGITQPVDVHQISPLHLADRVFPSLVTTSTFNLDSAPKLSTALPDQPDISVSVSKTDLPGSLRSPCSSHSELLSLPGSATMQFLVQKLLIEEMESQV